MKPKSKSIAAVLVLASSAAASPASAVGEESSPKEESPREDEEPGRRLRKQRRRAAAAADDPFSTLLSSALKEGTTADRPSSSSSLSQDRDAAAPGCGPTPGTRHSPYLGCYADRSNDRAFPFELHGNASRSKRLGHGALDCERECGARGFRYFGRQFKGQCFCGDDAEGAVKHGRYEGGRCDCCGANVGGGRMCVWENANHKDSQAQPPSIPVVLPQLTKTASNVLDIQPLHSYISASMYKNNQHDNNNNSNNQQQSSRPNKNEVASASTRKPTGSFRLRLHWQPGYNWQGNPREQHYCMECRGSCKSGSSIQVDQCDATSVRQKFIAVSRTVRPAANPTLCLTVSGYRGSHSPVKLRYCQRDDGGRDQEFREVRSDGKFELRPAGNLGRCLSQHHHPKPHEVVYPEDCDKTRRFDTTYWRTY